MHITCAHFTGELTSLSLRRGVRTNHWILLLETYTIYEQSTDLSTRSMWKADTQNLHKQKGENFTWGRKDSLVTI